MEGFDNFAYIPKVDDDAANIKNGVLGLGALFSTLKRRIIPF